MFGVNIHNFNSFLMSEKRLALWEEVIGLLNSVKAQDDIIWVDMSVGRLRIPFQKPIFEKLRKMIGKKIAILRTDIKGKEYLLREVS